MIQITDDQVSNGRHLRVQHTYGQRDVSSFLIQQGGKERLMKIQQQDHVLVDAGVTAAGLRRASARGRGVAGEMEAPRIEVWLTSLPPFI